MNQDNLIEIRDLSVEFVTGEHSHRVVNNVSFDIKRGETIALVGESGSGKSVTAHSILRLLPYPLARHPSGTIEYAGQDLLTLKEKSLRHIRGNRIAMIFQEPMTSLNPLHSIEKQINEVLGLHKGLQGRSPPSAPWNCSIWWASPNRTSASRRCPTNYPAASASG